MSEIDALLDAARLLREVGDAAAVFRVDERLGPSASLVKTTLGLASLFVTEYALHLRLGKERAAALQATLDGKAELSRYVTIPGLDEQSRRTGMQ